MTTQVSWGVSAMFPIALFLLALVVLGSIVFATRARQLSAAKVALAIVAALWLVPVLGILGVLAIRTLTVVNGHRVFNQQQADIVQAARGEAIRQAQERGPRVKLRFAPQGDSSNSTVSVSVTPATPAVAEAKPVEQPIVEALPGDSKLPDWVNEKDMSVKDKRLIVLTSQQFATVQEADNHVTQQARKVIVEKMKLAYGYEGLPIVLDRDIETRAYGRRHVEQIDRVSGPNTFTVYRVYRQLELSPTLWSALEPQWREQIAGKRLGVLGMLAGMMTLTVAIAAAYLRINAQTGAAYRRRLRFAAVCLVAAGGLVAMRVIG